MEMTRKEELVLWVLQMVGCVDGQQGRWWRMFPFTFSMILPFDEFLKNFNRRNRKRIEKDEVWDLWDVIWLRNEEDMKI